MSEHWADAFVRFLLGLGFAILILVCILMAINSHFTEKTGKSHTRFSTAAKIVFSLWILNNIALLTFGIMAEWFFLAKWELWASYVVAFLIGLVIWIISRRESSKDDRNLILFALLLLAMFIILVVALISLYTGHYPVAIICNGALL